MATAPAAINRRSVGTTALWFALAVLAGCVGTLPGTVPDSHFSYNRTFDAAVGAMSDQKMTFSLQDRLNGKIVATANGTGITATLQPQLDGTLRVYFAVQEEPPADTGLLQRVIQSYNRRMSGAKMLSGASP